MKKVIFTCLIPLLVACHTNKDLSGHFCVSKKHYTYELLLNKDSTFVFYCYDIEACQGIGKWRCVNDTLELRFREAKDFSEFLQQGVLVSRTEKWKIVNGNKLSSRSLILKRKKLPKSSNETFEEIKRRWE